MIFGPNGAGKTNLLEGLYFGCTGRSCRTANEREVVRFGASDDPGPGPGRGGGWAAPDRGGVHPGAAKRFQVDGANVERLLDAAHPAPGQRLHARSARADQGAAGAAPRASRSVRGRAVARCGASAPGLWPGPGSAQRADLTDPRRPGISGGARQLGSPACRALGIELMRDAPAGRRGRGRAGSAGPERRSGSSRSSTCAYRPRSQAAEDAEGLLAELREHGWSATSSAASPVTARTETSSGAAPRWS